MPLSMWKDQYSVGVRDLDKLHAARMKDKANTVTGMR